MHVQISTALIIVYSTSGKEAFLLPQKYIKARMLPGSPIRKAVRRRAAMK